MTFPLIAVALALCACLAVGRTSSFVVRQVRPAQAVFLLAAVSLTVSLASGIALTAIAVAMFAGITAVAAQGHWSAHLLHQEIPVPGWLGAAAALAITILLARATMRASKIVLALRRADQLCRQIRAAGGPVVILDDNSTDAYTIAGIRGCVVISQRLLYALTADERRVLTAHELSHLRHRHHFYLHIADIAAAGNPLLAPVSAAMRLGVERWADEDAAAGMGDRRVTGRALARVALLRSALRKSATADDWHNLPALGLATLQVTARVQALFAPPPRPRTGWAALALTFSLAVMTMGLASLAHIHHAIEGAGPDLQEPNALRLLALAALHWISTGDLARG